MSKGPRSSTGDLHLEAAGGEPKQGAGAAWGLLVWGSWGSRLSGLRGCFRAFGVAPFLCRMCRPQPVTEKALQRRSSNPLPPVYVS